MASNEEWTIYNIYQSRISDGSYRPSKHLYIPAKTQQEAEKIADQLGNQFVNVENGLYGNVLKDASFANTEIKIVVENVPASMLKAQSDIRKSGTEYVVLSLMQKEGYDKSDICQDWREWAENKICSEQSSKKIQEDSKLFDFDKFRNILVNEVRSNSKRAFFLPTSNLTDRIIKNQNAPGIDEIKEYAQRFPLGTVAEALGIYEQRGKLDYVSKC